MNESIQETSIKNLLLQVGCSECLAELVIDCGFETIDSISKFDNKNIDQCQNYVRSIAVLDPIAKNNLLTKYKAVLGFYSSCPELFCFKPGHRQVLSELNETVVKALQSNKKSQQSTSGTPDVILELTENSTNVSSPEIKAEVCKIQRVNISRVKTHITSQIKKLVKNNQDICHLNLQEGTDFRVTVKVKEEERSGAEVFVRCLIDKCLKNIMDIKLSEACSKNGSVRYKPFSYIRHCVRNHSKTSASTRKDACHLTNQGVAVDFFFKKQLALQGK